MQLTSILLYESLKEQFHIADYRLLSKKQPLARPFFYEADRGLQSSHIYLTEETLDLSVFSSMPEDVVLVICQKSKTSYLPKGRFSCILLSCDTSVIHVFIMNAGNSSLSLYATETALWRSCCSSLFLCLKILCAS